MQNMFEKFARIFSRRHKQTAFSDAGFLGVLRVNLSRCLRRQAAFLNCGTARIFLFFFCTVSCLLSFIPDLHA